MSKIFDKNRPNTAVFCEETALRAGSATKQPISGFDGQDISRVDQESLRAQAGGLYAELWQCRSGGFIA